MERLERLAAEHGVTLDAAAAKAGVRQSTLWRWRNDRASPTERKVMLISKAIEEMAEGAAA